MPLGPVVPGRSTIGGDEAVGGSLRGIHTVWTDGSGRYPTDARLRACTWAVHAGAGHPDKWLAGILPGPVQTIFRAELYAVIRALKATRGPLEVVSDCAGVVSTGMRYIRGKEVSPKASHADLWRELKAEAAGREVSLRWVPSHLPEQAVWGAHFPGGLAWQPDGRQGRQQGHEAASQAR